MAEAGTVNAEDRRPPGLGSGEMALQAFLRAAEACGGVCAVSFPGRVLREPALVKGGFPCLWRPALNCFPREQRLMSWISFLWNLVFPGEVLSISSASWILVRDNQFREYSKPKGKQGS